MISIKNDARCSALLAEKGIKKTVQRRAVLALLHSNAKAVSPAEAHRLLRRSVPRLGLPTVYRVLRELARAGLAVTVEGPRRELRYALCRLPHADHHHFVCRKCKVVEEVAYCNFSGIASYIERHLHARAEKHTLQIEGLCARCVGARS